MSPIAAERNCPLRIFHLTFIQNWKKKRWLSSFQSTAAAASTETKCLTEDSSFWDAATRSCYGKCVTPLDFRVEACMKTKGEPGAVHQLATRGVITKAFSCCTVFCRSALFGSRLKLLKVSEARYGLPKGP